MADERTRTERAVDHLAHRLNPTTIAKEMANAVTERIVPQGAAELAGALFGQGAYTPYGQGQEPIPPLEPGAEQGGGVHGPQADPQAPPGAEEVKAAQESADLAAEDARFAKAAEGERGANTLRTPAEREQVIDRWQGLAQAAQESHADRGVAPPMWSAMNREEMREAFAPPPQHPQLAGFDVAGQGAEERSMQSDWRDQARQRDRGISR